MWLSQQLSRREGGLSGGISTGRVTIAGEGAAVMLEGERRELSSVYPGGLCWAPAAGDEVLVLRSDEGERFIIGKLPEGDGKCGSGEYILRSEGGSIKLGKDGIEIEGEVVIKGRLLLNGLDVGNALSALGG